VVFMSSLTPVSNKRLWVSIKKAMQVLGATLGLLLFGLPAFSQLNFGRIFGGVTDQTGGAIVGAVVTVTDVQRGITRTLTTDEAGEYSAPSVMPGTYTVRADAKGFKATERQNITVQVGQDVRVDLSVQPGEQSQTVTVTESIPEIQTTSAQLTETLDQTINELPLNGREFTKLLAYRPGAKSNGLDIYVNGNRASSNSWMFDGLEDFNEWSASGPIVGGQNMFDEATILPIDTIQEVNVVEVPKAEYGWKPGAEVNVGLKSGTNSIHGTASAFGRDTAMDAKNQFLGALPKALDNMEQFGATIGGPIKKNKLFYYAGYEGQRYTVGGPRFVQIPTSASGAGPTNSFPDAIAELRANSVPLSQLSLNLAGCTAAGICNAANGLFPNSTSNATIPLSLNNEGGSDNGIGKIDYHPDDHNSFNGEYFAGDGYLINASSGITPYWRRSTSTNAKLVRAVWIWNPNSSWVNEARFGYNRLNQPQTVVECVQPGAPNYASSFGFVTGAMIPPPLCGFPQLNISGFTGLGQNTGQLTFFTVLQGADSVSYTRGKHLFKFGGEIHRVSFTGADNGNTGGTIGFGTIAPPSFSKATPLEDFLAGVPSTGQIQSGAGDRTVTFGRYALFVQDDWRITPRVIVNVGLRWEYATPYTEKNNLLGNFDPTSPTGLIQQSPNVKLWHGDKDNFAPRLGVAWDVTGKGTTVVRAGGSIVYLTDFPIGTAVFGATAGLNVIPTGWALENPNGSVLPSPGNIAVGVVTLVGNQVSWAVNQPVFNVGPSGLKCGNGLGSVSPGLATNPITNAANAPPCSIQGLNQNLQLGYVNTWNLAVQHAITNNLSATIAYVGAHGTKLGGFLDINQPALGAANTGSAPGSGNEQARRPFYSQFPYLGQIRYYTGSMASNYNALQATLTKRLSKGLTLNAGYSFEHDLDESASEGGTLMDSRNPRLDYSNSIQDPITHLTASASYNIPGKKSPGQLLEGWQINTIVELLGGVPFTAKDSSTDFSGTGEGNDRWTLFGKGNDFVVGGPGLVPCWGVTSSKFGKTANCTTVPIPAGAAAGTAAFVANMPAACVTAAAAEATGPGGTTGTQSLGSMGCYMQGGSVIVPPAQGTFGTMGRGVLLGAPLRTWDMSLTKGWKFKERLSVQFRAEFFNIINNPYYAQPSSSLSSPSSFGQAQATPSSGNPVVGNGGPRQVQLGLRLIF
jgi:Carboxypeptidase regulatory-like domain/TonB dependent receptor